MKPKTPCILAAALLLLLSGGALAAEVYTEASYNSVNGTAAVSVSVSISDVRELYGFQFDLTYDSDNLQFDSISEGPFLSGDGNSTFWAGPDSSTPGLLDNAVSTRLGMVGGLDGGGVLATLTFIPKASGTTPISLIDVILSNQNSERIPANATGTTLEYHRADTDCDSCIAIAELMSFIHDWKSPDRDVGMPELMSAIGLWRSGGGCQP
jgi:opacity protein-like surface antigen